MEEANTFTEAATNGTVIPVPTIVLSTPGNMRPSSDSVNGVEISTPAIVISAPSSVSEVRETAQAQAQAQEEDRTPLVSFQAPQRLDNEANVFFVNSRGILKSCDIKSAAPQSSSSNIAHLLHLKDAENQHPNMTIYISTEAIINFIITILDNITVPFILVSGDSDIIVPDEINPELLTKLLENPYLVKWAAQNCSSKKYSKMMEIPIGLHYHFLAGSPGDGGWHPASEHASPINQEKALIDIAGPAPHWSNRICKAYTNAHHRLDRFGDRAAALQEIPADLLVAEPTLLPRSESFKKFTEYAFVVSPFGHGYDCHRTWEALCCGSIPIIRGPHLKDIFEDLPVLRVEKWSDVTAELLQKTIEDFSTRQFKYEKLSLSYWINKIKKVD
jgi:hypothetical protein